jgi:hypothetical protein
MMRCPWCDVMIDLPWVTSAYVVEKDGTSRGPAKPLVPFVLPAKLPPGLYAQCPSCRESFTLEAGRPGCCEERGGHVE